MQFRVFADPSAPFATFHVVSRVVDRSRRFGEREREQFRKILLQLLNFCGVEALAWCCLSNHFHILLRIPGEDRARQLRAEISEDQLFERMKLAFSDQYIREVQWRVDHARREMKNEAWARDIVERIKNQMFSLPKFMHMIKRRFSVWFNKTHNRTGTLWEERYRSVLIENSETATRLISAYIDLNPVRAGLVSDPKDYRWCGYAEALAGNRRARRALRTVVGEQSSGPLSWSESAEAYRCWMFDRAHSREDRQGRVIRPGMNLNVIEKTLKAGGKLSRQQLLRCKIRHFTHGAAIGGSAFIENVFQRYRNRFGAKRKTGSRALKNGDWNGLCSLRNLSKNVIRPPG